MCVHVFGAVSSPSIANYIVKRMGLDSEETYGSDVRRLFEREFYVDNLPKYLLEIPINDRVSLISVMSVCLCEYMCKFFPSL